MKAEKTRFHIERVYGLNDSVYDNILIELDELERLAEIGKQQEISLSISRIVNLHDFMIADLPDAEEILRLAEIGKATENAFEKGYSVCKDNGDWIEDGEFYEVDIEEIASTGDELLEWCKEESK